MSIFWNSILHSVDTQTCGDEVSINNSNSNRSSRKKEVEGREKKKKYLEPPYNKR